MLLDIFKYSFIFSGILVILLMIIYKILFIKNVRNRMLSPIIAWVSFFLLVYILAGILLFSFNTDVITRLIVLVSILSPFIIGNFVTYEREKYYFFLQLLIVALSVGYIVI